MDWQFYPISKFESLASEWEKLNQKTICSLLFDLRFVRKVLNFFADGTETIAVLKSEEETKAIVILRKVSFVQWETFQPSQSPIGYCLFAPEIFSEGTIKSLAHRLPGVVLSLGFTQLDPDHYPRPNNSRNIRTLDYITTGRLPVPEDFEVYWGERSRNVKQNYNRARNRLEKQDITIAIKIVSNTSEVCEGVGIYGDIESSSWKASSGTAVSRTNQQGQFYSELLKSFSPDGTEVWQYLYNDNVVATDLCIKQNDEIIILKTTFLDEWNKYSPAFSMHIDGIKHLTNTEIKNIEFYGPAMDWHKKLTEDLRTMYHITWYRFPLLIEVKNLLSHLKTAWSKAQERKQEQQIKADSVE